MLGPHNRIRIALASAVLTTLAAAPALAAGTPSSPVAICGAGFRVIDSHNITGPKGGVLGTAYLLYDRGSKRNCAVMVKRRAIGTPTSPRSASRSRAGVTGSTALTPTGTTQARCTCAPRDAA